jgi:hypothetical protein
VIFGLLAGLVYCVMIFGPLARLTALADMPPLDLRPGGYDSDAVRALFEALGAEGRGIYLRQQLPLDTLYPALLALFLTASYRWALLRLNWPLWPGLLLPLGAALCDYLENIGIALMLLRWPALSETLVSLSSAASQAKAGLTTIAVLLVCAALAARLWTRWRAS